MRGLTMSIGPAYASGTGIDALFADYESKPGSSGGFEIDFTNLSVEADEPIISFLWNFDDAGATSALENPSHTFTGAGTYQVSLTVTDDLGNTNATSRPLTVSGVNIPPTANFTFVANNLEVTFTDTSTDADGTVDEWLWDFGD